MPSKIQSTSIRIEKTLLEKVKKDAEENKRSFSKQIEYIITKYYEIKEMTNQK